MARTASSDIDSRPQGRDWFVAAIETEGSVADSLKAVLGELRRRCEFVECLERVLSCDKNSSADAVTEFSGRVRSLENTLRFRLGVLSPERSAAWFRAPAATSTGPFSSTVIPEPVFAYYDHREVSRVRDGLLSCWQGQTHRGVPFRDDSPCLWRRLLELNAELEQLVRMPTPFHHLRLDLLPDHLPPELESQALRAFLSNVKREIVSTRERLEACFHQLWQACQAFWQHQERMAARSGRDGPWPRGHTAESVRAEFRKRRQTTHGKPLLTAKDREALRFMGFDEYPSGEMLRKRYLALAKQLHPDRRDGCDDAFKMLSKAYSHLAARCPGLR